MISLVTAGNKAEVDEDGSIFTVDKDETDYNVINSSHVQFTVGTGKSYLYSEVTINDQVPADHDEFRDLFAALFPDTDNGNGGSVLFGTIGLEIAATYAAINASTDERLIIVTADEANNGDRSLYLHNGTTKLFLQTIA